MCMWRRGGGVGSRKLKLFLYMDDRRILGYFGAHTRVYTAVSTKVPQKDNSVHDNSN